MSNDHYYVVIVPHADQAAQALTTTRVALGRHAPRHEHESKHVVAGKPPSSRAPSRKPASKRAAGAPHSRHPDSAPASSGRIGGGYVGGSESKDHREWSVVVGDDKYDVSDSGGACGYRIEVKGKTVWTGKLSRRGTYDTQTTTLPHDTLEEVLRLVYVGDQRHATPRASGHKPAALPSGVRTEKPTSTRRPKPTKSAARPKAPTAKPKKSTAPASATRAKPSTAKPKRTTAARAAKAEAKRPEKLPTSHLQLAPAAPPKAKEKPRAKRQAKPKAASARMQAGPLTQRTPVSQPSAKPTSHHAAPHVDDTAVLKAIRENLYAGDPSTAESHFEAMKRLWLGGGREATVAWMAHHKFSSVVDAFDDWSEKNVEAARAILREAPHGATKHAEVA